jgi:hypothetical protein
MTVKRHNTGSSIISALCNPSEMNLDREAIFKIFVEVGYRTQRCLKNGSQRKKDGLLHGPQKFSLEYNWSFIVLVK